MGRACALLLATFGLLLTATMARAQAGGILDCNCLRQLPALFTNTCTGFIPDLCPLATNCYHSSITPSPGYTCTQSPVPGTFVTGTTPINFILIENGTGLSATCSVLFATGPAGPFQLLCSTNQIVPCNTTNFTFFGPVGWTNTCCTNPITITGPVIVTNWPVITATWTGIDCNGVGATCTESIIFGTLPPFSNCNCLTIICPSNIVVKTCLGPQGTTAFGFTNVIYPPPVVSNSCIGTITNVTMSPPPGFPFPVGTNVVTCTVKDNLGNVASCNFLIIVLGDTSPPLISCAGPQTYQCGSAWTPIRPTAFDACCGTNVFITMLNAVTNILGPCMETVTITWDAMDCVGNHTNCTDVITIVDTLPPVIVCNSNQTYQCANSAGIPGGWTLTPPTATDACCGTNVTVTLFNAITNVLSSCSQQILLTWRATDCCTNSAFCTEVVSIVDTNPPILNCQPFRQIECGSSSNWFGDFPTAFDFCCGTNVTINLVSVVTNVNTPCFKSFVLTWTATDCCTNTSPPCIQTLNIIDTHPPVAICPTNKTINCGTTLTFNPPTAIDDCCTNPVTIAVISTVTNGPSQCPLVVTRTWSLTDCCGNATNCSQTVTVIDNVPPVIACASNLTFQCGSSWTLVPPTATDNCCPAATVGVLFFGAVTNVISQCSQTIVVTWLAKDCCGNQSFCTQTINITDTIPPVIVCNSNQVVPCANAAGIPGTWQPTPPTATDACCGTNVTVTLFNAVTNLSNPCNQQITLTWRATDCCSNAAFCTEVVSIVDTNPPILTCQPFKQIECGTTTNWFGDYPTAFDFCCGTNVTINLVSVVTNVNTPCFKSFVLTWTATDCCTNTSPPCIQTLNIVDTHPPVVTCPTNKTINCGATVVFDTPIAVDDCCTNPPTIVVTSTVTNAANLCPLVVTRTWTITDCCGNFTTCSQTVTIVDNIPPVIACASNLIFQCGSAWTLIPPFATDNCCPTSGVPVILNSAITNFSGPCSETIVAIWEARDCCGNKSFCTQTIHVIDTVPPVLACNSNQTYQCANASGIPGGWTLVPPTATDACCGTNVTVSLFSSVTNVANPCNQLITLTWQAVDCCTNVAYCTEVVSIIDTNPPVITCAPNKVVECGTTWTYDPPTAFDSCCGTNVTIIALSNIVVTTSTCLSVFDQYWIARDCCSNYSTVCRQRVFVQDKTPPAVTCPSNLVLSCGSTIAFTPPSAIDLCCGTNIAITVLSTITNGPSQCPLVVTRTWSISDCCGNTTNCSQTITVIDNVPPVIACASNLTFQCGTAWTLTPPSATDNCCATTTIIVSLASVVTNTVNSCLQTVVATWQATDCCGNKSFCTQTISITDTIPPVITCNSNQTYQCGQLSTPNGQFIPPTAIDACCGTNVTVTLFNAVTNGSIPCNQIITLTWKATDCCTNSAFCTELITITDTNPPSITCSPNKIVECGTAWTYDPPTAFDQCCGTNVTILALSNVTVFSSTCLSVFDQYWIARDCCTNYSTICRQRVFVRDLTPPAVTCPTNLVINCGSPIVFTPPTATDLCCGTNVTITVVSTLTNGPGICPLVVTRTWQISDCCGNSTNCSQTISVVDNVPPVITCAPNLNIQCGTPWTFVPPTVTDNCCLVAGTTAVLISATTNHVSPCQDVMRAVWKATDCCGNTSFCTNTVTVSDTIPPVISCTNYTMQCGSPLILPIVTDACCPNPTVSILGISTNITGFCTQVLTIAWQAMDCCTNTSRCTNQVTVIDTVPPLLTCASNITVQCGSQWSFTPPTVSDACCQNVSVVVAGTITNISGCTKTITRTWKATDCCSNTAFCNQVVTIVDTTPPIVNCAPNKTVQCNTAWVFDPPTGFDACCGSNVTITVLGTFSGIGTACSSPITRYWLIQDCCGNFVVCAQTVFVVDTIPPVIICGSNFSVASGTPWTFTTPSASDNCCLQAVQVMATITNITGPCTVVHTRTWRAVDCCGNVSPLCSQSVTVTTTPPPNDPCTAPIALVLNGLYICGSNICATPSAAGTLTPTPCGLSANAPDVWYTVTAVCTAPMTVDTCPPCPPHPTYDTVLSAYTGNCGSLVEVSPGGCNDDYAPCGLRSSITFPAIAGQTYRIRVSGYAGAVGWFMIRATQTTTAPPNDLCVNAIPVTFGNPAACGTTLCGATPTPSGILIPTPCGSSANAPDVWYRFTPLCSGSVSINTCGTCPPAGTFDTVLSVYTGNCGGPLNQVAGACNDDSGPNGPCPWTLQSYVTFNAVAGTTYYIRVAGWFLSAGNFRLNINQTFTPPPNDLCAAATPITAGSWPWNNCGANTDGPAGPCAPNQDVWFTYTPNCTGTVTLNTCLSSIDTVLAVYSGPCTGLSLINCNDNAGVGPCAGSQQSYLTFTATAGTTYRIRVGGAGAAMGSGVLNVIGPNPVANTCPPTTGPSNCKVYVISGPGNGTSWAWNISSPCCANFQNLNVPGVVGSPATVASAFASSINGICPGTAASFGPFLIVCLRCPGPILLSVGPAGTAPQNLCLVGGTTLPTSGVCSFNPDIVEVPATGHDLNNNGLDDYIDIAMGTSADVNGNMIPDEVETCFGPQITTKPQSQIVTLGQSVTLNVEATGTLPFTYQWYLNGQPIAGATTSSLNINPVTASRLGDYTVTVSNACGFAEGAAANLSVIPTALPVMYDANLENGWFRFTVETKIGFNYMIEYKNDLSDPTWTPLTNTPGNGQPQLILDTEPPPAQRYYRIRQQTGP